MIVAIVQARMTSVRLPGKVMLKINGEPLIQTLLYRLSNSKYIDKFIVATPTNSKNDELKSIVEKLGFEIFQGSEKDVLDRYYHAARLFNPDSIVRITGDCPLIDHEIVDKVIKRYLDSNADYVSNVNPPTFPDGLDAEIFSYDVLKTTWKKATKSFDREHVTPFIVRNPIFKKSNILNPKDYSKERWTLDEPSDFIVIKNILHHFKDNRYFTWNDILKLKEIHPEYFEANKKIIRNEGTIMKTGQKLYKRAKQIFPGGNMLLSKRPEMFLPDIWPSYFMEAKGCNVWDLDNNKYIDMSIMGIGTNTLGYGNEEVDDAVRKTIDRGNMSTLNCPEEVYLAEKLIELHPWASMVRFTRTGGEANAVAIRIARAASGKDKVAFCGYHGWHDWYLAANLGDKKSLDGHLMPGLDPKGVPRELKGTIVPFKFNSLNELEKLTDNNDIGVIKMEVFRNMEPEDGYLEKVRELATRKNIVLIFDECTSGFRQTFGGLHKLYGVEPDMALLGKALGNGYAINTIIGKSEFMQEAQNTFISSTFWTERIGPTAGLKTLEVMEKTKSWEYISSMGGNIRSGWKELGEKYSLPIQVGGLLAIPNFSFATQNWLKYKTFITQEMLKQGYLATNAVFICIKHTENIVVEYLKTLEPIFATIAECEDGKDIDQLLEGPVCHAGFKRLN